MKSTPKTVVVVLRVRKCNSVLNLFKIVDGCFHDFQAIWHIITRFPLIQFYITSIRSKYFSKMPAQFWMPNWEVSRIMW